jgi:hypothetical protein
VATADNDVVVVLIRVVILMAVVKGERRGEHRILSLPARS